MTLAVLFILLLTILCTSFISGIFGMAGGLILMAVLVSLVSVAMAMILHGLIQMFANGYRAFLLRDHIQWSIVRFYCIGALAGLTGLFFISWTPDRQALYLMLGLIPLLIWVPGHRLRLDICRPAQAVTAGFMVQGLNTLAGVAGPLLDLFFVRSALTRQQIVATKSITQTLSHLIKTGFWSLPLLSLQSETLPPVWLLCLAAPVSMLGTRLGKMVLDAMSDQHHRDWMKGLVTALGGLLLLRAAGLI